MHLRHSITVLALLVLAGCSSITSIQVSKDNETEGLYYYMPYRDFILTLTVEGGEVDKVAFGVTPSYPDLSKAYVLNFAKNWVGKNTLDVTITEQGLLSVANSTTISGVSDIFKNLASSIAAAGAAKKALDTPDEGVCKDGNHILRLKPDDKLEKTVCGVKITIALLDTLSAKGAAVEKPTGASYSGLFYRQNLPYLLTVKAVTTGIEVASIQFSPSKSATHFMPVSRTFFANNSAEFVFSDGVPTKYKQDTEGELIALLKLPADVIGAYFTAVGGIFDAFKTRDDKQTASLVSSLQLDIAKKKYTDCLATMNKTPPDQTILDQLGCNKP